MKRIAFATCDTLTELTNDDRLAFAPLNARGIEVTPAVWSDPAVDWSSFDAVILRSTWDYNRRFPEFMDWLETVSQQTRLFNPLGLVQWNFSKDYLLDLEKQGVNIVPTHIVRQPQQQHLTDILTRHEWPQAVVKPVISIGGHDTWIIDQQDAERHQFAFDDLLDQRAMLVQPYMPEIKSLGEVTLVFFGGQYSHAVLKQAAPDEFRIHEHYGGKTIPYTPDADIIAQAQRVVDGLSPTPLYNRVDGVVRDGTLMLMELELIEPFLYLSYSAGAAERFAEQVAAYLG